MFYNFKIHKEKDGFWAECIELKGCVTEANSHQELVKNMEEVLNLYLDEPEGSKIVFPLPNPHLKGKNIIQVPVNPKIAFALKLKLFRSEKGLSQKQIATLLGMKNIYSYQRLESTKKANPNLSTIAKIKSVFPDFSIEDIFISSIINTKNTRSVTRPAYNKA